MYPSDWPRCPSCDEPCLDGKVTCGRAGCGSIAELQAAIDYVNTNHPLPRCRHSKALQDHGGEELCPPCGCRM